MVTPKNNLELAMADVSIINEWNKKLKCSDQKGILFAGCRFCISGLRLRFYIFKFMGYFYILN